MPTDGILTFVALVLLAWESTADNQQLAYHAWKHRTAAVAYDVRVHWLAHASRGPQMEPRAASVRVGCVRGAAPELFRRVVLMGMLSPHLPPPRP
jgi:hypothetical protein